jgi:Xaa-Pro dipeptidase
VKSTRVQRLKDSISEREIDAFVVIPSPTLLYLSGIAFHLMERPTVAIFQPAGRPRLILPKLEVSKAEKSSIDFELYPYEEDEASRLEAFQSVGSALGGELKYVGIEPLSMRAFELGYLQAALPDVTFLPTAEIPASLRTTKDEEEIAAMRRAVIAAEKAMENTLPQIQAGMTEMEVAAELVVQLLRAGSEPELPFSPIVASGPNSALPHATASDRRIQPGELLIIDWGARIDGYVSDLTRTFAMGEVEIELKEIYQSVKDANAAGVEAVQPGVPCSDIDRVARSEIVQAGFGEYFIHRTGHGIGLEPHEDPNIREGNPELLEPGMTFTVEPGIYIPERGGVRIEDNVVTTQDGGECMSTFTRELQILA